jgi:large subunit ribosomal protein L10
LAIKKQQKQEIVKQYQEWLTKSHAAFVAEYVGLNVKNLEELRRLAREKGGEFHVVKNTLMRIACKQAGFSYPESLLEGSSAIGFAFEDPPGLAKVLADYMKTAEALKVKGGFLGKNPITAEEAIALANLPSLPVLRAQLIGIIQAPASKLARLMAEPGRSVAAVCQAYATKEG